MKFANQNAAYDFARFEQHRQPVIEIVEPRVQPEKKFTLAPLKAVILIGTIVTVCALMIFNQMKLNEVSNQISDINIKLTALTGENIRLQNHIDSSVSVKEIDKFATEQLGLIKPQTAQIEYLSLATNDRVEILDADTSVFENIQQAFSNFMQVFQ